MKIDDYDLLQLTAHYLTLWVKIWIFFKINEVSVT